MPTTARQTVHVRRDPRGDWEVVLPGHAGPVYLETLDDAKRVAYPSGAHRHPCELVLQDAYKRVLEHELTDGSDT